VVYLSRTPHRRDQRRRGTICSGLCQGLPPPEPCRWFWTPDGRGGSGKSLRVMSAPSSTPPPTLLRHITDHTNTRNLIKMAWSMNKMHLTLHLPLILNARYEQKHCYFTLQVLHVGWLQGKPFFYIVSASCIATNTTGYQIRCKLCVFVGEKGQDLPPNISGDLTGSSMQYFASCSATSATSSWPSFGSSTPLSVPLTCRYDGMW
jgi:hypothetical protein